MLTIPSSHRNLLDEAYHAVLTTMMPDGQPQSSIVWCDYDGEYVLVNTTRERQKSKNMLANPKVTLVVIDPADNSRWIEIRGEVEITEAGALEHIDAITRRFTHKQHFYGDVKPLEQRGRETRIIAKIKPIKITLDAIHK